VKRRIRRLVKHTWLSALRLSGALAWARRRIARERAIVVLMFHRVLDDNDWDRTNSLPGMIMRARTFDSLIDHVVRFADVVSAEDARPGSGDARKPRLIFTFDDGWADNATVAHPIAEKYQVPFTIFVCPGLMDAHEPFWTERAVAFSGTQPADASDFVESLKRLPPSQRHQRLQSLADRPRRAPAQGDRTMGWNDVLRLQRAGVSFGSHSYAHEILTFLEGEELSRDLERARSEIEKTLQLPCSLMAYPNGGTSTRVAAAVAAAGHEIAFTTQPRLWMKGEAPHHVPRINMCEAKLVGLSGAFSGAAFDYAVYWRPFMAWVSEAGGWAGVRRFVGATCIALSAYSAIVDQLISIS
jgi:peptidoglycan/xylan/chitin deacetylase (PgdA/CDA1 family)